MNTSTHVYMYIRMTDFTENAMRQKSTTSRNSNFSVQIQIKPKSQFEFVLRDIKKSEFFDMVDFRGELT